jgi:hypothetical protein
VPRKRWLPHLIAAFVVFHVVASLIDVTPDVSLGMDRRAWRDPRVQFELKTWSRRLGMDQRALEDDLWFLGRAVMETRRAVETPFRPYLDVTGQRQAWAMFIAGSRFRDRFEVRARRCPVADDGCDWQVLFDQNDDDHAFLAPVLENARIRSAVFRWGWPQMKRSYQRGCDAIAKRAFAADAGVVAVECRFERSRAPGKDEPAGDGEWGRSIVVEGRP